MQLDKKALGRLLSLNDEQLKSIIRSLGENAGLDLASFKISADDVSSIRRALMGATDDDLARASEQLTRYRQSRKGE